jgi:hypothetical protein
LYNEVKPAENQPLDLSVYYKEIWTLLIDKAKRQRENRYIMAIIKVKRTVVS